MDLFSILSEERIKKAYKDKEFENLPGFRKPLPADDLATVPESIRMAYRILKNGGFSPGDEQIRHEMLTIENLIKRCEDPEEKEELQTKLNEKMLRFNQALSKRKVNTNAAVFKNYEAKINDKLK